MNFKLKDPASAITHFIGFLAAVFAAVPLLIRASHVGSGHLALFSMTIFILSMILLYGASTTYHSLDISTKVNTLLKKWDHMMVFVLIAGTYTPLCTLVLGPPIGYYLCAIIWGLAILGMLLKAFWVFCPKWVSSVIYIAMGWICILFIRPILSDISFTAFAWLLAGGIIYTVGGVIYALKLPIFNQKHSRFGTHDIFHLFCLGGSFCHYIFMFCYVLKL